MLHVGDFDIDHHVEKVHRPIHDAQVGDVALVAGDHGGETGQAARLIGDRDLEPSGVDPRTILAHRVPADVDPAFRGFREALQRRAVDGVDGDALAGRYDADNAVAG